MNSSLGDDDDVYYDDGRTRLWLFFNFFFEKIQIPSTYVVDVHKDLCTRTTMLPNNSTTK